MIKTLSASSLLACALWMTSTMTFASRADLIEGKYHCVESSQHSNILPITSDLTVSKTEKGLYQFHWDYSDGTHFDGLSSPKKRPSSSFTIQYSDQAKSHLPDQQPGFETFEVQKQGKVIVGRFSTLDHKDAGEEKCTVINTH